MAAYFGVTGTCYAGATIAGGYVLDRLIEHDGVSSLVGSWNIYHCTSLFAWITRSLSVGWLWLLQATK